MRLGGGGVVGPAPGDAATQAWVAQVIANGGAVSATRRVVVDQLIFGLKSDGLWTQLDRLWILAAENAVAARTDMVALTLATVVGSPAFATDLGYTGTDVPNATDYINTGAVLSSLTNFVQNSGHISGWCVTNLSAVNGAPLMGAAPGANTQTNIYDTFSGDNNIYVRLNDGVASGAQGIPGTRAGHWLASRTSPSGSNWFHNGGSATSITVTSGTVNTGSLFLLAQSTAAGNGGNPNQIAMASVGGGLTTADAGKLYLRLRTYMTAVGVP